MGLYVVCMQVTVTILDFFIEEFKLMALFFVRIGTVPAIIANVAENSVLFAGKFLILFYGLNFNVDDF